MTDRHETNASGEESGPLCRRQVEGCGAREEHDEKHDDTAQSAQSIECDHRPCGFAQVVGRESRSGIESSLCTEHADTATRPCNLPGVIVSDAASIRFFVKICAETQRFGEQHR